jgi:hypothetical protein
MHSSITNRTIRNSQGDFSFGFVFSRDWEYMPFATNVHVISERKSSRAVISLAVNQRHKGISQALVRAKQIDTRYKTMESIEKMRHALFDYSTLPEHIHSAVIGNIGRLSLAHALRTIDLSHPDVVPVLFPVLQEYDARTTQQYSLQHNEALNSNYRLVS